MSELSSLRYKARVSGVIGKYLKELTDAERMDVDRWAAAGAVRVSSIGIVGSSRRGWWVHSTARPSGHKDKYGPVDEASEAGMWIDENRPVELWTRISITYQSRP